MPGESTPFDEIEQLFEEFSTFSPTHPRLAVDIVDRDEEVIVLADMPGRDVEDIEVTLKENRRLLLSATERETDIEGQYVTRERSTDELSRVVSLPTAVDDEGTAANYTDGVLRVTLPKHQTTESGTEIPVE
jgi:HSP20 family protein